MKARLRALTALLLICSVSHVSEGADDRRTREATEIGKRFTKFDLNGDGKLAGDELAAPAWLKQLDANGDGVVLLEEAQEVIAAFTRPQQAFVPSAAPPPLLKPEESPRQEPKRLKPAEHGVGSMVADLAMTDLEGKQFRLSEMQAGQPLVIALFSPSCPVSKRYGPTLASLAGTYRAKDVRFLVIAPIVTDTPAELRAALRECGLNAPCVRDESGMLSQALRALATTDVFLLDAARTLIYRGAVDDQYGLGYSLDAPRQSYLAKAIDALLAGGLPEIAATEAPGCVLDLGKAPAISTGLTYHNRISRLVQSNCQQCHRAGGVAPFALESYEQVLAKAGMIRRMVERDLMPPWFAAPPLPGEHSPWLNDRSLSKGDKADLLAWLNAGKPVGDPKDAPLPRQWPSDWQIGTPDAIVQIPEPIEVKATGTMPYQHALAETGLTEDKWVRGFEVRPTAREVVHHVLIFVQEKGQKRPREDGERGGFFAAYVPGNNSILFPEGFAKPLPAGSRLLFQIHYTPNGTATRDQIRIGLLFAKEPPRHIVRTAGIADHRLTIPPGADNHAESGTIPVPRDVRLLAFMPHMHVRGKAFRYEAIFPNGDTRTLLEVPRYDFNWQLAYRYAEPPALPAGSKVRAIGWFDNSDKNPANPDPTRTVRWGPQTSDEMLLGYVEYYFPDETKAAGAGRQISAVR